MRLSRVSDYMNVNQPHVNHGDNLHVSPSWWRAYQREIPLSSCNAILKTKAKLWQIAEATGREIFSIMLTAIFWIYSYSSSTNNSLLWMKSIKAYTVFYKFFIPPFGKTRLDILFLQFLSSSSPPSPPQSLGKQFKAMSSTVILLVTILLEPCMKASPMCCY